MATSYLTAGELRTGTQNAAIAAESSDAVLEGLIERAERFVDSVAGYWSKYDSDQTRLFPRTQDVTSTGATFIPDMIKEATIIQSEFMYLQTPDDEDGLREDDSKKKTQVVSPRLKALLRGAGMTRRSGKVVLSGNGFNPDKL